MKLIRNLFFLILVFVCFYTVACSDSKSSDQDAPLFAIYLLLDESVSAFDLRQDSIEDISISNSIVITEEDIISYGWSEHEILLSENASSRIKALNIEEKEALPFIVVAGNERIYIGSFWSPYSSYAPPFPTISSWLPRDSRLWIHSGTDSAYGDDVRNDNRVYQVLEKAGILIQ